MWYPSDRYFIDFPSKADGNVGAPTRNNGSNMCSLLGMLTKGHPQKLWQSQMNQPGWRIWEAVPNKDLTSIRLVSSCTARTSLIRGWYLKPARNGQNPMEHVCFNVKHELSKLLLKVSRICLKRAESSCWCSDQGLSWLGSSTFCCAGDQAISRKELQETSRNGSCQYSATE
jgi:hypothetical protein